MADQQYDLFFNGQLLEGHFEDFVKADLKNLFKANDDYINKLFSGGDVAIKRAVDKATAIKFQQAFKQAGAKLIVRVHGAEPAAAAKPPVQTTSGLPKQKTAPAPASVSPDFQLTQDAIAGENDDALIEHHQPDIQAPSQTPAWDVAAAGTVLVESSVQPVANIDTSRLSVADAGTTLTEASAFEEPAPVIDTSSISLAAAGTDIETLTSGEEPVVVDISHLSVEP